MRRVEAEGGVDVAQRLFQGLAGQAVHQVEIEGVEMLAGQLRRPTRLFGTVDAAQRLEMRVVEALDAE